MYGFIVKKFVLILNKNSRIYAHMDSVIRYLFYLKHSDMQYIVWYLLHANWYEARVVNDALRIFLQFKFTYMMMNEVGR